MKNTKEVNQEIRRYILSCVNFEGYDKYAGVQMSEVDRLRAVYQIFKSEYLYPENLVKYGNERNVFAEWLRGLPSSLNIEFRDSEILKMGYEWEFIKTESGEGRFINHWFDRMASAFFSNMDRKETAPKKIKTIDINAMSWFDKVNGNSYFAAVVTVDFGLKSAKEIKLPFQYGYGSQHEQEAGAELDRLGIIKLKRYPNGNTEALHTYCTENKIILRSIKAENCKKADLKNI
jgi:hypothetical protein